MFVCIERDCSREGDASSGRHESRLRSSRRYTVSHDTDTLTPQLSQVVNLSIVGYYNANREISASSYLLDLEMIRHLLENFSTMIVKYTTHNREKWSTFIFAMWIHTNINKLNRHYKW